MGNDNKVINLKSKPVSDGFSLPQALVHLRDASGRSLAKVMAEFFDRSDDVLFNMADRAGSNQEQVAYFDAMRELRLQRTQVSRAVVQWVARAFNELGDFDPQPGNRNLSEVEADSLTLMDTSQLEQTVALDNLMAKLRNRYRGPIHLLTARVSYLVRGVHLEERQMPLSPEVICSGLGQACGDLDMDIRAKLVVFKLFDRLFIDQLDHFYDQANRLLKTEGVMPELRQGQGTGNKRPDPAKVPQARQESTQGQQMQWDNDEPEGSVTFSELSALLRRDTASERYQSANASHRIDTPSLVARLGAAQKSSGDFAATDKTISLTDQLEQLLVSEAGQPMGLQQVDGDVINLVSMLFDFILEDRQVPVLMKALIGRLQIPVLKVALCDRSFFNRGGHPARKLLNELAMAAIGWNQKAEGQKDPLREKMESVVGRLLNEFNDDVELFAELLEDFSAFVQNDLRRRELIEKRLRDAEEGRARQHEAKQIVDNLLSNLWFDGDPPEAVESLLLGPWHSYLQWVILRQGESSERWSEVSALTEKLIWSVNPQPQEANTRQELLRTIPGLVDSLRKGLQSISWDPFAIDGAIRDLELTHVDVLQRLVQAQKQSPDEKTSATGEEPPAAQEPSARQTPSPAQTPSPGRQFSREQAALDQNRPAAGSERGHPASSMAEKDAVSDLSPEFVAVKSITETRVDEKWMKQADQVPVGSWIELQMDGNTRLRCKLAAFIKATGKYIFVNRNGAKMAEYDRESLGEALSSGHITLLDDGLIFDRALESIIDNLRQSRRD